MDMNKVLGIDNERNFKNLFANTILEKFTIEEIIDIIFADESKQHPVWTFDGSYVKIDELPHPRTLIIDRQFSYGYNNDEIIITLNKDSVSVCEQKIQNALNEKIKEKYNKVSSNEEMIR